MNRKKFVNLKLIFIFKLISEVTFITPESYKILKVISIILEFNY